jgi:hypothetical protein
VATPSKRPPERPACHPTTLLLPTPLPAPRCASPRSWPRRSGAIEPARRFGERLLCVRYRRDESRQLRYTTVELIVECVPLQTSTTKGRLLQPDVYVRIEYFEHRLQALVRDDLLNASR